MTHHDTSYYHIIYSHYLSFEDGLEHYTEVRLDHFGSVGPKGCMLRLCLGIWFTGLCVMVPRNPAFYPIVACWHRRTHCCHDLGYQQNSNGGFSETIGIECLFPSLCSRCMWRYDDMSICDTCVCIFQGHFGGWFEQISTADVIFHNFCAEAMIGGVIWCSGNCLTVYIIRQIGLGPGQYVINCHHESHHLGFFSCFFSIALISM